MNLVGQGLSPLSTKPRIETDTMSKGEVELIRSKSFIH